MWAEKVRDEKVAEQTESEQKGTNQRVEWIKGCQSKRWTNKNTITIKKFMEFKNMSELKCNCQKITIRNVSKFKKMIKRAIKNNMWRGNTKFNLLLELRRVWGAKESLLVARAIVKCVTSMYLVYWLIYD